MVIDRCRWFTPPMGGWGFPHLRVSAGTIPVGNAIDVWRVCLRATFSSPHGAAKGWCGRTYGTMRTSVRPHPGCAYLIQTDLSAKPCLLSTLLAAAAPAATPAHPTPAWLSVSGTYHVSTDAQSTEHATHVGVICVNGMETRGAGAQKVSTAPQYDMAAAY
jgi:hypothetical protein